MFHFGTLPPKCSQFRVACYRGPNSSPRANVYMQPHMKKTLPTKHVSVRSLSRQPSSKRQRPPRFSQNEGSLPKEKRVCGCRRTTRAKSRIIISRSNLCGCCRCNERRSVRCSEFGSSLFCAGGVVFIETTVVPGSKRLKLTEALRVDLDHHLGSV